MLYENEGKLNYALMAEVDVMNAVEISLEYKVQVVKSRFV